MSTCCENPKTLAAILCVVLAIPLIGLIYSLVDPGSITVFPAKAAHLDRLFAEGDRWKDDVYTDDKELKQLLDKLVEPTHNVFALAAVNKGFVEFAINWLCSAQYLGISNYLFYTTDADSYRQLRKHTNNVYFAQTNNSDAIVKAAEYGTVEYQQLVLLRTKFVSRVLALGFNVLLCDVDAVWLQNPFNFLEYTHDIEAQPEHDGRICGGFMLLRNTSKLQRFWHTVAARHVRQVRSAKNRGKLSYVDESEQTIMLDLIQRGVDVDVHLLDSDLFPFGRKYFGEGMSYRSRPEERMPAGLTPVVIHNNYIIGKEKKIKRFKHFHLWFVRRNGHKNGYKCWAPGSERERRLLSRNGSVHP